MLTINKQDVTSIILLETKAEERKLENQIKIFEKKYGSSYEVFIRKNRDENIEDDYIDWTATLEFLNNCKQKLKDLESGNYNIA